MANQNLGRELRSRRCVAVAASPRQNAAVALSALLVALLAMWPVAILLRLAVRL